MKYTHGATSLKIKEVDEIITHLASQGEIEEIRFTPKPGGYAVKMKLKGAESFKRAGVVKNQAKAKTSKK